MANDNKIVPPTLNPDELAKRALAQYLAESNPFQQYDQAAAAPLTIHVPTDEEAAAYAAERAANETGTAEARRGQSSIVPSIYQNVPPGVAAGLAENPAEEWRMLHGGGEVARRSATKVTPPGGDSPPPPPPGPEVEPPVLSLGYSKGGWRSTISPQAREEAEQGFLETGDSRIQELGYLRQAQMRGEAIRQAAAQKGADELNDQIGRAEGQYFTGLGELRRAEKIKNEAQTEADNAIKEAREAKVDPTKFYKDRDSITNIGLALNVGMGGFWSTVIGGPNSAMEIVDRAISRDIAAQEVDLKNKRASADTALRRNFDATGDLDKAKDLTRLQMLEVTRMQAQKMAMDRQSAIEEANHEKIMASLQAAVNKTIADLTMSHAKFLMTTEHYAAPQMIGAGLIKRGEKDSEHYVPGLLPPGTKGTGGLIRGEATEVAEVRKKVAAARELQGKLDEMGRIAAVLSEPSKVWGKGGFRASPEYSRLKALSVEATSLQSTKLEQGVIRTEEWPKFAEIVGNADSPMVAGETAQQILHGASQDVAKWFQTQAVAHNAQPVYETQMVDESGLPAPVYIPMRHKPIEPAIKPPGPQLKPLTSKK